MTPDKPKPAVATDEFISNLKVSIARETERHGDGYRTTIELKLIARIERDREVNKALVEALKACRSRAAKSPSDRYTDDRPDALIDAFETEVRACISKLPKVWVVMQSRLAGEAYLRKSDADGAMEWANKELAIEAHQYAPVQPPRKCVWRPSDEMDWWKFSCDTSKVTLDKPRIYCQFCGGRITRRSPR